MSQAKVDSNHRPSPYVRGCSTIELSARDMLDVLLPLLTKSVNDSLSSGDVPVNLMEAAVLPC